MNETPSPDFVPAEAKEHHRRVSAIWLLPVIAILIAGYLGFRAYSERGPSITITFNSAEGLITSQTQVKYKAVPMGTVEDIDYDKDMKHVVVTVRMTERASRVLTDHARFWVVRPRFDAGGITGVETLVSGAYIQCDPGTPGGKSQDIFTGLEDPPGIRSDEPGQTFVVQAERLGSISAGSPVYYRDINVGEVLGYDIGDGFGPIKVNAFVRAPFDRFVHQGSRFWNASGLSIGVGATGLHVELQSLQSVLSGGVAFYTPPEEQKSAFAAKDTLFPLYHNFTEAETAGFRRRIRYVTYFQSSVRGLAVGAPVQLYGIQIGDVSEVTLLFDSQKAEARVKVAFEIQPERAFDITAGDKTMDPLAITRRMVEKGMRVRLDGANLLTGQKLLSLQFVPKAKPQPVGMENGAIRMPSSESGGIEAAADALTDVATKLNQIPFGEIGENLNELLSNANQTLGGQDMKNALHDLSATMAQAQDLMTKADRGLTPTLARLPEISAQLQSSINHANGLMSSLDQGSDFQRQTQRTMDQVGDAARSIHLLADFLNRHPEALIQGRADQDHGEKVGK